MRTSDAERGLRLCRVICMHIIAENANRGICHHKKEIHLNIRKMSTALALTEKGMLEILKPKMADLVRMIGEDTLKREASFAIQIVNSNSYLQMASPATIAKALFNMALTDLSLNPILKLAYITPRKNKDGEWEAILMPSYQGLVKLIADTGSVSNIYAYIVYEGDIYEEILGTEVEIKHVRKKKSKTITDVYAVAILPDGKKLVETMSADEVHEIRSRSDSYRAYAAGKVKTCVWVSDPGEMFRKTVIKRISKYIPKTDRWLKVSEAINLDNSDYPASWGQVDYILSLINTCTYDDSNRDIMRNKATSDLTQFEAQSMIDDLKENQLQPGKQRDNVSAKEANDLLNNATK